MGISLRISPERTQLLQYPALFSFIVLYYRSVCSDIFCLVLKSNSNVSYLITDCCRKAGQVIDVEKLSSYICELCQQKGVHVSALKSPGKVMR